jgi:hypothetical protein
MNWTSCRLVCGAQVESSIITTNLSTKQVYIYTYAYNELHLMEACVVSQVESGIITAKTFNKT